jgi:hypothetical protein
VNKLIVTTNDWPEGQFKYAEANMTGLGPSPESTHTMNDMSTTQLSIHELLLLFQKQLRSVLMQRPLSLSNVQTIVENSLLSLPPSHALLTRIDTNGWLPLHLACYCVRLRVPASTLLPSSSNENTEMERNIVINNNNNNNNNSNNDCCCESATSMNEVETENDIDETNAVLSIIKYIHQGYPDAIRLPTLRNGDTALHIACYRQPHNVRLLKYLLEQFPDAVRLRNHPYGSIPLHLLCEQETPLPISIQVLIQYDPSSIQIRDNHNSKTPFDYLTSHHHDVPLITDQICRVDRT